MTRSQSNNRQRTSFGLRQYTTKSAHIYEGSMFAEQPTSLNPMFLTWMIMNTVYTSRENSTHTRAFFDKNLLLKVREAGKRELLGAFPFYMDINRVFNMELNTVPTYYAGSVVFKFDNYGSMMTDTIKIVPALVQLGNETNRCDCEDTPPVLGKLHDNLRSLYSELKEKVPSAVRTGFLDKLNRDFNFGQHAVANAYAQAIKAVHAEIKNFLETSGYDGSKLKWTELTLNEFRSSTSITGFSLGGIQPEFATLDQKGDQNGI